MRIIKDLNEISSPLPGAVVTIGNFDGVHLGHREIFRRVVREARRIGGTSVVFTFSPHPRKVLDPENAPKQINTDAEKERLIAASCIDVLICARFTPELAELSADRFVREILLERVGTRHLIVGYDYAFGRERQGNVDFLRQCGENLGFKVEVIGPVSEDGKVYSSTRIREMVLAGQVVEVARLLGRHFTLEGKVVHGAKRGHKLGFPTANLATEKEILPRSGVYAVKVRYHEKYLDGVVNIGCKPTFRADGTSVEVHLFNFHQEIYGENLRIYFLARLRDERLFPASDDLARAIAADIEQAKVILQDARVIEYREYLDCGYSDGLPGKEE